MNDLISRQDALSCFYDWIDQRGDVHTADEMPEYQRIEQLPSAQPKHSIGHWIHIGDGYVDYCKCSECGNLSDYEENFCCECGANMRGNNNG